MIDIEINNAQEIASALERLAQATAHRAPLMRSIAGTMESAVLQNFDVGGRPKWLGLKYRQGTPLVDTENLMASITSEYRSYPTFTLWQISRYRRQTNRCGGMVCNRYKWRGCGGVGK
ncbi:phage virion morphogenesis protein [Haemophilus influenzae]|uniref:G protein n=1 Tax=Haemophilus influenzae F3047 TaxID=935897 RepID=A0AAV2U597_HAEIF|nr:phage virion morphogenesis protein [Haemophilus influenzae]QEQ62673.1 phage virion morphogenesis protein [Haemophilus influenzae biotype aegyptius]QEQ63611.1 phage virion morphogenesis protein [Haemophilus influenzae biotype aegyptius]QEQ66238.1 phage virion morphogenesis protein [Haemophilus influenzae biotype aegyptius]CBY81413.1 G protein [Haemophilus influenzae F3031]CBY87527.1 G protein [Haemophilus influenzae F3047]